MLVKSISTGYNNAGKYCLKITLGKGVDIPTDDILTRCEPFRHILINGDLSDNEPTVKLLNSIDMLCKTVEINVSDGSALRGLSSFNFNVNVFIGKDKIDKYTIQYYSAYGAQFVFEVIKHEDEERIHDFMKEHKLLPYQVCVRPFISTIADETKAMAFYNAWNFWHTDMEFDIDEEEEE